MSRLASLLLVLILAALSMPSSAQTVIDSVRMDVRVYQYDRETGVDLRQCGAGVYAVWPNVLQDLFGSPSEPFGYADYGRVATDGMFIPSGVGEAETLALLNLTVPDGYLGHNPQIAGTSNYNPNTSNGGCANIYATAQTYASGVLTVLNGQPFQITEWYATFSILDGTPIALFLSEPGDGFSIDFDASFESMQSREIDENAPANKVPVASYAWDFGDGESGTGAKPSHEYAAPGEYDVILTVTDDDGETASRMETVTVASPTAGAADEVPSALVLGAPYPNPTGGDVAVSVTIQDPGSVRVSVFDALGREVAVGMDARLPVGQHAIRIEIDDLPSGVYLVRLAAAGETRAQRLTVVR